MSHQSELIADDILAYLEQHENKDLLRFITCGSVDDGKSTLIGRLLHDSKLIFDDQLAAIRRDSQKFNTTDGDIDLALLVDGLQAEREQGITIDVAYRYFSTDKRKFIIADCPGHEQYTRNMATGASTCDLAVILIDARRGVQTQTRRHSFIVSLLGIRHVLVAVNKMDLVDFQQDVYDAICEQYTELGRRLDIESIAFVPVSALRGDNVVKPSTRMPWYEGETLMQSLEAVELSATARLDAFRFPVQYVNRPNLDFRGFAGTVAAGRIRPGDAVTVLPSGKKSRVRAIVTADGDLPLAHAGQAITLTLEDEIDISRGDVLVQGGAAAPQVAAAFDAKLVWMDETALIPGREYLFKLAGRVIPGRVEKIDYRSDVNSGEEIACDVLRLNEIGHVQVRLDAPLAFDAYSACRVTGSFIVIDRMSNATAGAGMIVSARYGEPDVAEDGAARWLAFETEFNALVRKHFPHWEARDIRDLLPR
ncbi:sulfate adenylyltransferase subunit CysN [Paludibacterium yongneupense]|uniref:sulfate adenylyltransferase subunit CysN n=1 Tax=Paludibacterium yongneupense TaxID=400061 RepID=UPI0003F77E24|nr:sulfate adenylyltransferase subunit CysN [Paludibacterium yongneupense]